MLMYHSQGLENWAQEPTEQKGWWAHLCSVSTSVKGTEPSQATPRPSKEPKVPSRDLWIQRQPGAEDHARKNMGCDQNPVC